MGSDDVVNSEQIDYWNSENAAKWVRDQAGLDRMFASVTDRLLALVQPRPGEAGIDVGCGTGATTMALAETLGGHGHALGVDVSVPMLAMARSRADKAGLSQVQFLEADAQTHAFEPAALDLLISRFGVMFFEDPVAAFANLGRAMKPGARLCFLCWAPLAGNPWFAIPRAAAIAHMGKEPPAAPDPRAPGPLAFAEQDYVLEILRAAGWSSCAVADEEIYLSTDANLKEVARLSSNLGPAVRVVRALDGGPADLEAIAERLMEELAPFVTADGVSIPARFNVVQARR